MKKFSDLLRLALPDTKKAPRIDPKYATLNRRMIAATIDSLFIMAVIAPVCDYLLNTFQHPLPFDWTSLQEQLKSASSPGEADQIFFQQMASSGQLTRWIANCVLQTVILCIATGLCWRRWSATPGKILLRMRIADATTEMPMSNRQIIWRLFGYLISTIFLCGGFFWIGVDKHRQGWHDKMANTVVLLVPRKKNAAVTTGSDQAL